MAGYQRQAAANIQPDLLIDAADLNAEFDAIAAAFHPSSGHVHDGSIGNGPKISLTTSVSGVLPILNGGTGGNTQATARTSLGLGTLSTLSPTGTADNTSYLRGDGTWASPVRSVGISVPSAFTVSDSPVTTTGTMAIAFAAGFQGFTTAESNKLAGIASGATSNATDAQLRDRATHTGNQAMSTITGLDTALAGKASTAVATTSANGLMSASDKTKLNGVSTGATKNATDAQLRDRGSHTGTQAMSTVTGLDTALTGKLDVSPAGLSTVSQLNVGSGYYLTQSSGLGPIINFDSNDFVRFNRSTDIFSVNIGGSTPFSASPTGVGINAPVNMNGQTLSGASINANQLTGTIDNGRIPNNLGRRVFTTGAVGLGGSFGSAGLEVVNSGGQAAYLTFHRGGSFAANLGVDNDNQLRYGGNGGDTWIVTHAANFSGFLRDQPLGGIGTYALVQVNAAGGHSAGAFISGSNLRYACAAGETGSGALSGTWRLHGGIHDTGSGANRVTLAQRIS